MPQQTAPQSSPLPTPPSPNRILEKMLDRLLATLVNGPSLNCRPHRSRQRVDLTSLARLQDAAPADVLQHLLRDPRKAKCLARAPQPPKRLLDAAEREDGEKLSEADRATLTAWRDQEGLLAKLRAIAEDARTYEQDTGVHVLSVGFPLLSLPPRGLTGTRNGGGVTRRILAPIAFIPVSIAVGTGATRAVEIRSAADGADRVIPNAALLAWLEQQTGRALDDLFDDAAGSNPCQEIHQLVAYVAEATETPAPDLLTKLADAAKPPEPGATPAELTLTAAPRTDAETDEHPAILSSAVLGLFPVANQGLLRDTQALLAGEPLTGPIAHFVQLSPDLEITPRHEDEPSGAMATPPVPSDDHDAAPGVAMPSPSPEPTPYPPVPSPSWPRRAEGTTRWFADDRLVTAADPCQARAVRLARNCPALVVHGPPGTGKSQTITNVIGDHLARGQRVLVVSDKRTALDVVSSRLRHLGLGDLFGLVHDPQRDQRELYKALRQQLDDLPEATSHADADAKLAQIDVELQNLHGEISRYATALMARGEPGGRSFHDLVGEWFGLTPPPELRVNEASLQGVTPEVLDANARTLRDVLQRAAAVDLPRNPWRQAAGIDLATFLARPMAQFRAALSRCATDPQAADATADPDIPAFARDQPLDQQAAARVKLADELANVLMTIDPAILAHWAGRDPSAAKAALDAAAPQVAVFRSGPLDTELLATSRRRSAGDDGKAGLTSHLPSREQTSSQWRTLREYAQAYREWAGKVTAVRQAAPRAGLFAVTQWLGRDEPALRRARQRLDAMKPMADAVAAAPLDRQLALQFARQPVPVTQVVQWLAALHEYAQVASKWYGFLNPGPKKAAKPITQHFGVPLDLDSANHLRAFLTALRLRLDLKADLEDGILPAPLPDLPSDDDLLTAYQDHAAVVAAALTVQPAAVPSHEIAPTDAVHSLMRPHADAATVILKAWDLDLTPTTADRLATFLGRLNARLQLMDLHYNTLTETPPGDLPDDAALDRSITDHGDLFAFLQRFNSEPLLAVVRAPLAASLKDPACGFAFVNGLRKSPARAQSLIKLASSISSTGLFDPTWLSHFGADLCAGKLAMPILQPLAEKLDTLESVLRAGVELKSLPDPLRAATASLVDQSATVAGGFDLLRKAVLGAEILRRLAAEPNLHGFDAQRLRTSFDRYRELEGQKQEHARRSIRHRWLTRQKEKLLANTGTRLNSAGADLRRRLTLRGERAMRLRQVIAVGRNTPGGADPLFDLCPVWMASPETVAQIFPREPIFDVVIFDEASQCRLEEALPVLTRAKRVVVAGDPRQLPPTRFFESAFADSDGEAEIETDQQLFEHQQGQIEDLLAAALNLAIQECYLDVHYRSRNADLIEFSNEHFYGSRLQAIPGHSSHRVRTAPLALHRVDGVYAKRCNEREADEVVRIVRDLLTRADPPSIGIACFNLPQRDLIVDKLDEAAEADPTFARRLDAARRREGSGSFEGLFVKNLENVQGDERDHLIISTTYGPDAAGKFRRQFGPVGQAGGGRRLNVLVTRARHEVHLVTSIPQQAYRSLPPVPPGQTPGGAYLLLAYLRYAEDLGASYDRASEPVEQPTPADRVPHVEVRPTKRPSRFAESLAKRLATDHGVSSDVHWGNDGFCVDLALRDPAHPDDVTLGVLCDATRFAQAADPVEWDVFRTGILESQGWTLHRLWTPHFYRDAEGNVRALLDAAGLARHIPSPPGAPGGEG